MNKSTIVYSTLFLLTTLSLFLADIKWFGITFVFLLFLTALIKGQLIIDYFMGLKEVNNKYRMIPMLWLVFVVVFITIFYLFPSQS